MPEVTDALVHLVRDMMIARWEEDQIVPCRTKGDAAGAPTSIRAFIAGALNIPATARNEPSLAGCERWLGRAPFAQLASTRFADLLAAELLLNGQPLRVESMALAMLFVPTLERVVTDDLDWYAGEAVEEDEGAQREALIKGCGVQRRRFLHWVKQPQQRTALAQRVWPLVLAHFAHKSLLSHFVFERGADGWYTGPHHPFDRVEGQYPLRRELIQHALGPITFEVQRSYTDTPSPVFVHAWRATLTNGAGVRQAVAAGMAYVGRRKVASIHDWMSAADETGNDEIMQVNALIEQHPDAFADGMAGGIAFVTAWERHPEGVKGSGGAVLSEGLYALSRALPRVRGVAIDLRPPEYRDWDLLFEPAEITTAKQESREQLAAYLDALRPEIVFGGLARRYHFLQTHDPRDNDQALRLLGRAALGAIGN